MDTLDPPSEFSGFRCAFESRAGIKENAYTYDIVHEEYLLISHLVSLRVLILLRRTASHRIPPGASELAARLNGKIGVELNMRVVAEHAGKYAIGLTVAVPVQR